ncbi:MAG TPA: hypothetical protein ENG83_15885 [Nitrospirae bacterium]|nr:motility protein B [bacterium BMS3Abin06]HDH13650.1 hypothetical protein [Nitrospirota bacterium]HDZ00894.1 hypothetical protein [Nitrospirota bacterium]
MGNQKAIIIKKVKKHGGGGHHGGSWKVAYADFVTAMMAFFLLLWLLNMTSDEKRVRLSQYFKHFSIYTEGGTSFLGKTSEMFSDSGESKDKVFSSRYGDDVSNVEGGDKTVLKVEIDEASKKLGEALKEDFKAKLGDVQDQVLVDLVDGGVRVQMVDKDGSSMFELGGNKLTPKAKKVFRVIGANIKHLTNKVAIEGHTDALPYAGNEYSNWELSTERASSARKELEANGLDPGRIDRVSGFAATDPLIKDDPADPRNRRISIILKITKEDIRKSFKKTNVKSALPEIDREKAALKKAAKKMDEEGSTIKMTVEDYPASDKDRVVAGKRDDKPDVKKPAVIKELSSPVITNGQWNPVLDNKDGWGPVSDK